MLNVQREASQASFRDAVQSPDRKDSIQALVNEIASKLPPQQLLACAPICLSKTGNELVNLRVGQPTIAEFVRSTMLTLELFKTISADSFEALRNHIERGVSLSDWHAINAETYGLGQTSDSPKFSAARTVDMRSSFWRGFRSAFDLIPTTANRQPNLEIGRLKFDLDPKVRDIFISALSPQGTFRSPESTQNN